MKKKDTEYGSNVNLTNNMAENEDREMEEGKGGKLGPDSADNSGIIQPQFSKSPK